MLKKNATQNCISHFVTCQNNCCKKWLQYDPDISAASVYPSLLQGSKVIFPFHYLSLILRYVDFMKYLQIFNFSKKVNPQIVCEFDTEAMSGSNCNHFLQQLF